MIFTVSKEVFDKLNVNDKIVVSLNGEEVRTTHVKSKKIEIDQACTQYYIETW